MKEWLNLMEGTIIPFQISKGMVIHGSFVDDDDDETYIWIRRFSSLKSKEKLYKDVYESKEWLNEMVDNSTPKVLKMSRSSKTAFVSTSTMLSNLTPSH